jgi:hypothetical protein
VAGREERRGECQTRLGLVWRETGAVRNARPSRGQAAAQPKEDAVDKDAQPSGQYCWKVFLGDDAIQVGVLLSIEEPNEILPKSRSGRAGQSRTRIP